MALLQQHEIALRCLAMCCAWFGENMIDFHHSLAKNRLQIEIRDIEKVTDCSTLELRRDRSRFVAALWNAIIQKKNIKDPAGRTRTFFLSPWC